MKAELIARLSAADVQRLRAAYDVIAATYEDVMGGPLNCRGIKEYHAIMDTREKLRSRFNDLTRQSYE